LITLRNFSNAILDQITYVDAAPWPTQPDGTGPSLEIIDPLADNNVAANWRASTTNTGKTYGTPTAYSVFASPGALPVPGLPTLKFAPVVQWVNETKDSASIVLNLTGANPAGVSFKVDIVGAWGTATEVVDFGTLSKDTGFAAGMLGNLTIKVPVQNDALNEGDEYAVVRLSNVVGASVVDGFYHTLHIIDNDRMAPVASNAVSLSLLSSIRNMTPNSNSAEIVAYDKATKRLWIVNSIGNRINIVDMTNPAATVAFDTIDITPLGGINSIAIKDNVIVGAFENANKLLPGQVVFFDANGNVLKQINAGVLPDMVGISPDGKYVVTANEAEPAADYLTDPEGSVTVIDISGGIAGLSQANANTISLASLNPMKAALIASGVRIFGRFGLGTPVNGGSSVAQDLEPEYVAFSPDSKKAYITVQEANALLVIDLDNKSIALDNTAQPFIKSLGFKDHSLVGNGLDASDQADSINISRWRVKGMYMPDAIATLAIPDAPGPGGKKGSTYFITANEGDAREYSALTEETALSGLRLDPVAFPDSLVLRQPRNLGRINFTNQTGDTDGDGDMDELYVLGGRSFTIWDSLGNKVWDSGDDLEQIVKQYTRPFFNANNGTGNPSIKNRSDNKGPEPEGVTVANICDKTYAFVTLERSGGVVVYDVTDPTAPVFVTYANNRTSPSVAATADTGPEGILFIPAAESPNNQNLLLLANEISSSVSVFQVNCSPVQPVDLLRFDGRLQAGDAVLQWQIASADDLKYFELQHSTDARNFKPVGTLPPAGTNYQFVHTNLPDGKHYYRLQTAEKDGQKKLSRTVVLVKGAGNSFVIGLQQNPVRNGFVTPNLYSAKAQLANANITDVAGRNVGSTKMQLKKGQQQWQIAAPAAAGIYFLTITTEDGLRETIRFVK
jgi:DNA-binding beta-propeller fold protein YncE